MCRTGIAGRGIPPLSRSHIRDYPHGMNTALYRRHRKLLFSGRRWRMRLVFWGGALAVGVTSVGFAAAATQASLLFHHLVIRPWLALAVTPLGFMLSAWMAQRFFPGSQGSGIPQAIAARHMKDIRARDRMLSLRLTFGKIFLTLFGMACGASIGREGPTVQVGAAILLQAGRIGRMMGERGLILAGAAASFMWRAAMAWGMPEPWLPGKKRAAIQADSTKPSGVMISASQGWTRRERNRCVAWVASAAKATLTTPTASAPPQNTSRIRQRLPENSSLRWRR